MTNVAETVADNIAEIAAVTQPSRIQQVFEKQHNASRVAAYPTLQERLDNLDKLEQLLKNNQPAIADAINLDFGNRANQETRILEIYGLVSGCQYSKKRLKKWMKPQKRHVGLSFFGARNTVLPQPKGVVGIVTPWNYPLFLAFSPCISALAAGNRCVIKMAAKSQNLCRLMDNPEWARKEEFGDELNRWKNQAELDKYLGQWTRQFGAYDLTEMLQKAGIATLHPYRYHLQTIIMRKVGPGRVKDYELTCLKA